MNRPRAALAALMWLLAALGAAGWGLRSYAKTPGPPLPRYKGDAALTPAAVVPLSGEIDDYTKDAFERRFEAAKRLGAKTIIVRFDTYGGLVTSGWDLSRYIKNQTTVHTIAYVDDKAISAGAMIAMACDEIVMCRDGSLGDCAPIAVNPAGQVEPLPATERSKMESPVLADFEDSATRNHHDPLLAHAMVSVDTTIYWLQSPTGEHRFVRAADYQKLLYQGWKPADPNHDPLITEGHLLTVNTDLAVKLGLASGMEDSVDQLAEHQNLNIIARLEPSVGEQLIDFLNQALVRGVLLMVLALSIYICLHAPGHGLAEAIGVIALGLLVGIPLLTGYATWWEIVLIFVGLAVMAIEIFVLPHAGMLLAAGGLMMAMGFVLTFAGLGSSGSGGYWPRLPQTWMLLQYGLMYVVGALVASILVAWWISRYLPRMPVFNRLVLSTTSGSAETERPSSWPPVGAIGRTLTPLRPGGTAEFFDEIAGNSRTVVVSSESGYVEAGASVIVREVDSSHVKVRVL